MKKKREVYDRILVTLPRSLKKELDALRPLGYTISGFVCASVRRALHERKDKRTRAKNIGEMI